MDQSPGPSLKSLDILQAIALIVTIVVVIGGGFLAYGVLKAVGESNREDLLDLRTQSAAQFSDLRNLLRALEDRQRVLGERVAEIGATLNVIERRSRDGDAYTPKKQLGHPLYPLSPELVGVRSLWGDGTPDHPDLRSDVPPDADGE